MYWIYFSYTRGKIGGHEENNCKKYHLFRTCISRILTGCLVDCALDLKYIDTIAFTG